MSTILTIGLPTEHFALRETLPVTDVAVEVERVVPDGERVMPFLWANGGDLDAFEDALADDPTVESVVRLDDLEDGRFYRMHWVSNVELLVGSMTDYEGTVLKARGEGDRWELRMLFPDDESVTSFRSFFADHEFPVDVESVHSLRETKRYGQYGLTEQQYEALVAAYEEGHYELPAESTVRDLADGFDVSHQAISERLTRGHRSLVENALIVDGDHLQ